MHLKISLLFALVTLLASQAYSADNSAPETIAALKTRWHSIFNGRNFDGWTIIIDGRLKGQDPQRIFQVRDGIIHVYSDAQDGAKMPFGYILTDKAYRNYDVSFEYKWGSKRFAPRANLIRDSGLLYGVADTQALPGVVWPRSIECQVAEGETGDIYAIFTRLRVAVAKDDDPLVRTFLPGGERVASDSLMMSTAAGPSPAPLRFKHNPQTEHPGWNTVEVRVREGGAVHLVNGVVVNAWSRVPEELAQSLLPGAAFPPKEGRLLLQAEGAEVLLRNVRLREDPR